MQVSPSPLRLEPFKVACSTCNLRELCLPVGLSNDQMLRLDDMVAAIGLPREKLCTYCWNGESAGEA